MSNFIRVTDTHGDLRIVNVDHICDIGPSPLFAGQEKSIMISLTNGRVITTNSMNIETVVGNTKYTKCHTDIDSLAEHLTPLS